jgi:hypothetical protein
VHAEARIKAITADLARRSSTRGDAFSIQVEGRTITQRKAAGAALLTKMRLAARERAERHWTIARIGGFDLTCDVRQSLRDPVSRHGAGARLEPSLVLERTEFAEAIDFDSDTTPAGLVARLEHALDRMEEELEEHRRRFVDAKARLVGYEPRLGEVFLLQGELDAKLAQLADIEADLARTEGMVNDDHPELWVTSKPS